MQRFSSINSPGFIYIRANFRESNGILNVNNNGPGTFIDLVYTRPSICHFDFYASKGIVSLTHPFLPTGYLKPILPYFL